jgi:hypothetical protein
MTTKLDRMKLVLAKKEEELEAKFQEHFADVKSANGQPLDDKRNGRATTDRWERQNDAIRSLKEDIERRKKAIDREEDKQYVISTQR